MNNKVTLAAVREATPPVLVFFGTANGPHGPCSLFSLVFQNLILMRPHRYIMTQEQPRGDFVWLPPPVGAALMSAALPPSVVGRSWPAWLSFGGEQGGSLFLACDAYFQN